MQDYRVRGIYVASASIYTKQTYSAARAEEIHRRLSPDLKEALPRIKSIEWYPLHFVTEQLDGIYHSHDDPDDGLESVVRCGQFVGDQATSTFLRLIMKILTIQLLASKWQQFWGKYHNFGVCVADACDVAQNKFYVRGSPGYPYVHGIGAGWLRNVFYALGKKNVVVTTDVPRGVAEKSEILWTTTWTS